MSWSKLLKNETETILTGKKLGLCAPSNFIIHLEGDLGAGKTTLCRGFLNAYGYSGAVKSPTYTLVEPYDLDALTVYHFDLYRLGHPEELEFMGIRDFFDNQSVCLVEWPEKGEGILPSADLRCEISVAGRERVLNIKGSSERGHNVLSQLEASFKPLHYKRRITVYQKLWGCE